MCKIKERGLSRGWFLVGLLGVNLLDLAKTGRWSRDISRSGEGRIESLQRRLHGDRKKLGWKELARSIRWCGRSIHHSCLRALAVGHRDCLHIHEFGHVVIHMAPVHFVRYQISSPRLRPAFTGEFDWRSMKGISCLVSVGLSALRVISSQGMMIGGPYLPSRCETLVSRRSPASSVSPGDTDRGKKVEAKAPHLFQGYVGTRPAPLCILSSACSGLSIGSTSIGYNQDIYT